MEKCYGKDMVDKNTQLRLKFIEITKKILHIFIESLLTFNSLNESFKSLRSYQNITYKQIKKNVVKINIYYLQD